MDFRLDMYTLPDVFLSHSAWARRVFASLFCEEGCWVSTLPGSLDLSESHKVSLSESSSSDGMWSLSSFSTSSLSGEVGGRVSEISSIEASNLTVLGGTCRCSVISSIVVIVLGRIVPSRLSRSLLGRWMQ